MPFIFSCCGWGDGSYQLALGDDVLISGGTFKASETKTFTITAPTPAEPACYDVVVNLKFDMYPQVGLFGPCFERTSFVFC